MLELDACIKMVVELSKKGKLNYITYQVYLAMKYIIAVFEKNKLLHSIGYGLIDNADCNHDVLFMMKLFSMLNAVYQRNFSGGLKIMPMEKVFDKEDFDILKSAIDSVSFLETS